MGLLRTIVGVLVLGLLFGGGFAFAAVTARSTVSLTAEGPDPATVTIDWGDTVAFSNADTVERAVESARAEMASGPIPPGASYEFRFTGRAAPYRFTQTGTRPTTFGLVVLTTKGKVTLAINRQVVPFGASSTLAGRSSYPGTPVQVQFRPTGATSDWAPILNVTAAGNGAYSGRTRLTGGGRLRALVAAGQVSSEFVDVSILPRLQMRVRPTRVSKGSRIVVTGRVTPARAATSVDLEERRGGENWQRKSTKAVSKQGVVTFVFPATAGRNRLRLTLKRGALNAGFEPVTSRSTLVVGT
jgi:hypothetical protein